MSWHVNPSTLDPVFSVIFALALALESSIRPQQPPPCPSNHSCSLRSQTSFLTSTRSSKYRAHASQEQPVRIASLVIYTYQTYTLCSRRILAIYRNAIFPELINPRPGQSALTLHELFLSGMARGADRPCLGWRTQISSNPVKYANKYEWLSYAQVNERRLNLGSAIEALFRSGRAGGGELPTVGIWCKNRPGAFSLFLTPRYAQVLALPFLYPNAFR